ncbi:hypothetical protein [Chitinilyticum piscinae]|uniref:Uncharacterized protein n=1 Tax=Chitinilyticum piscinae TaxID=2866724 RepID=A0A8J7KCQ3_9NEIS|nr:hypothetical protein [Chitinilyticum piscinae]MBE9607989.1 hypothetical protein [Chitinilyticum piscinae]
MNQQRPLTVSGFYSVAEYNARVASAQACRAGITAFWSKAADAATREEWEHYAAAARDMEVFAPRVEAQARRLGLALGLPLERCGQLLSLSECEALFGSACLPECEAA